MKFLVRALGAAVLVCVLWWMAQFSPFNGTRRIEWTFDGTHHVLEAGR